MRMLSSTCRNHLQQIRLLMSLLVMLGLLVSAHGQKSKTPQRNYPKEIRGYKVERAPVDLKQSKTDSNELITFGQAEAISVSPLGVTLEIPIIVAPVKQKGRADFLTFEDIVVNGSRVTVDNYYESFDLPNDRPLRLRRPLTIFVALPTAILGAVGELTSPQETWPVTGVVYVYGQYRKYLFKFRRVIPVEVNVLMRNPLRSASR